MLYNKFYRFVINFDEIKAVLIVGRGDIEFRSISLIFINLLAEGIEDLHHARYFATEGHAFIGGIGEKSDKRRLLGLIDILNPCVNNKPFKISDRCADAHVPRVNLIFS